MAHTREMWVPYLQRRALVREREAEENNRRNLEQIFRASIDSDRASQGYHSDENVQHVSPEHVIMDVDLEEETEQEPEGGAERNEDDQMYELSGPVEELDADPGSELVQQQAEHDEELTIDRIFDEGNTSEPVFGNDVEEIVAEMGDMQVIDEEAYIVHEARAEKIQAEMVDSKVEDIRIANEFIRRLQTAKLATSGIPKDDLERLLHPEESPLVIDDLVLRLSLDIFLAVDCASQQTYTDIRDALLRFNPTLEILTYDAIKSKVKELSGVYSLPTHQCVNTCIAFTGPFEELDKCPMCGEARYDPLQPGKQAPRRVFHTILLGPQIQALRRTPQGALEARYRAAVTAKALEEMAPKDDPEPKGFLDEYGDIHHGLDILEATYLDKINENDFTNEGLPVWDAIDRAISVKHPVVAVATADGPGMALISGMRGRRKDGGTHYYPAALKPSDQNVPGSNHDDYNLHAIPERTSETTARYNQNLIYVSQASTNVEYNRRRFVTGISRPSIFSGLNPRYRLPIPAMFPGDLMHLASLNITDLMTSLWRGTLSCDKDDDIATWDFAVFRDPTVWAIHGQEVAMATPYLPGSFDRPPRNPVEKINSGYKAIEFLNWVYGLAPALLYGILPFKYWRHLCKLVQGIRLIHQHVITSNQLKLIKSIFVEFIWDFETLYYQRKGSRIHFCRPSLHALSHLADQVQRVGPPVYTTQFPMERFIGDIGTQVNALKAMIPELDPTRGLPYLPYGCKDLGNGYVLLRAKDPKYRSVSPEEAVVMRELFPQATPDYSIWSYILRRDSVLLSSTIKTDEAPHQLAMVSLFSDPDQFLAEASYGVILSCVRRTDEHRLVAIDVRDIKAVVAMVPHTVERALAANTYYHGNIPVPGSQRYFVVEKLGLEVASLAGVIETTDDD
ncbi:hypothetical protein A0H81_05489 [Grifola frondosa]|uniref:Transposase family Tnp2 protein n=1 Tax=Grifola frondosa TaxID=5627 RepID=A0A1C7MEF4_GRIFR|nr:hypothetical protein A0H81_05489 [Grifola frondosa]